MTNGSAPRSEVRVSEPEIPGLSECIALLRRAMRRAARAADPANTLTVAQLELMASLAERPGTRPGELARRLRLAPNTITTLINAIAPRGLISRTADEVDRRAIAMHLTDAGHEALGAWQETNAEILRRAVAALPAAQRRALSQAVPALDALAHAIDQIADATG